MTFSFTWECLTPEPAGDPYVAKINPAYLRFAPSPDHDVQVPIAGDKVNEYVGVLVGDDSTRVEKSFGKPTPDADGFIYVPMPAIPKHVSFQAQILTKGPGGEAFSGVSQPFVVVGRPASTASPSPR